jgi:Predicted thiol oxidoreductase
MGKKYRFITFVKKPVFTRLFAFLFVLLASLSSAIFLLGCDPYNSPVGSRFDVPAPTKAELLPAGAATIMGQAFPRFDQAAANLPQALKANFFAGKALAEQPWIKAPATTNARDGLGPIYNARSCLACHIQGGRGIIPANDGADLVSAIVRLSVASPSANEMQFVEIGVWPEPRYGDQLQTQSTALAHQLGKIKNPQQGYEPSAGEVLPEAYVSVDWLNEQFVYPDKTAVQLRRPKLNFSFMGYGEFAEGVQISLRNAPAIHGMGLLELIDQYDINRWADPSDNNRDGISGRINQVWDSVLHTRRPGRFGHKANRPNVASAVAAAFVNDVGITNPIFPQQPCTEYQLNCLQQIHGAANPSVNKNQLERTSGKTNDDDAVELPQHLLELVINFNRNLGVPQRRDATSESVLAGREHFYRLGCAACHRPSYTTQKSADFPHLSEQIIWPYTDLLLHDMGPELADGRPDFLASGSEWRTPPLWSLGLSEQVNGSNNLLHDGRAQSVEEAILWHGGEAAVARDRFVHMSATARASLIAFVNSL